MRTIIPIVLLIALSGCSTLGFDKSIDAKKTVLTQTTVVYPALPDIDKPLPPILKPIKFDYPRDISKPKQVINSENCNKIPRVNDFENVCMEYPILPNSNLFIGMNQQSFQNYLSNQELINGYSRSLNTRLDEVNAERAKWRESNQQQGK